MFPERCILNFEYFFWELSKQGVVSNLGCPEMVCGHACCSLLMPQGSGSTDSFHLKMLWLNKDTGCALLSLRPSHTGHRPVAALRPLVTSGPATTLLHCGWLSPTACRRCAWGKCACLKDTLEIKKTVKIIPGCYICCITAHSFPVLCQHTIISASNLKELYLTLV